MSKNESKKITTGTIVTIAMLCAIAFIAKWISNFLPTVQGFLSFDLKDIVIAIGGFVLGPLEGFLIALVVSVIEMVTISSTGPIGLLMNLISSCSFACVAAVIYHHKKSMKSAVIGLFTGVLCMTVMMLIWNYLITPLYMGVPRQVVAGMLTTVFLPFNLAKGGINAALSLILYKPIVTALRKAGLVKTGQVARTTKWGLIIVALVVLASCVLWGLVLADIL